MPAQRRALPPKPPSRDVNAASRCCPPATVSSPRLPSSSPRPAAQRCAGLPSRRRKSREPRRPTRPPPAAGRGVVSRFSAPPVGLTRSPRFHVLHTVCPGVVQFTPESPLSCPECVSSKKYGGQEPCLTHLRAFCDVSSIIDAHEILLAWWVCRSQ